MSMNLAFKNNRTNKIIQFPYQTTTKVSMSVMKSTNNKDRLAIIAQDLSSTPPDPIISKWYSQIRNDLNNTDYTLIML